MIYKLKILALALIMFAIGWASQDLSQPKRPAKRDLKEAGGESSMEPNMGPRRGPRHGPGRGPRGGPGRGHRPPPPMKGGPALDNIEEFSSELALSAEQKEQLEALSNETMQSVKNKHSEIRAIFDSTQDKVESILTQTQLQKLQLLKDERWQRFIDSEVQLELSWFVKNGVAKDKLVKIEAILATFHQDVKKRIDAGRRRDCPPEERDPFHLPALARDQALNELIGQELSQQYLDMNHRSRPSPL